MSRIWLGFVAACGVTVGTVYVNQLVKAAEDVTPPAARKASVTAALSAADSSPQPKPAAAEGQADRSPARTFGGSFGRPLPAQTTMGARPSAEAALPPEPLTVLKSGREHTRLVYRLKNSPVNDMYMVIKQLFRMEGELHPSGGTNAKGAMTPRVAIASSVVSNSLVISGPPDVVEEVRMLLDKLDLSGGTLLLEVEIGEVPIGEAMPTESPRPGEKSSVATTAGSYRLLERPASMETTGRFRLTTLDGSPAYVQMGSRVPTVMSETVSAGRETRSVSTVNMGLILSVTPRIGDRAVTMKIDVEKSQLGPENEGTPVQIMEGKVVRRAPRIDNTTLQTTVTIPDGQTVILGGVTPQGKSDKVLVIIVTPHIIGLEEAKKAR